VAPGTLIYTDEYAIYNRLDEWGYEHESVNHGAGEYARDDDGDGFCEVHVNTMEGFWALLRSYLYILDSLSLFITWVNAEKALLYSLIELLIK
jgi:transposase